MAERRRFAAGVIAPGYTKALRRRRLRVPHRRLSRLPERTLPYGFLYAGRDPVLGFPSGAGFGFAPPFGLSARFGFDCEAGRGCWMG